MKNNNYNKKHNKTFNLSYTFKINENRDNKYSTVYLVLLRTLWVNG